MSMKTSTRQVDGITIVDLSGRITLGEGSVLLRDVVRDLVTKGHRKILVNLGDVTYITAPVSASWSVPSPPCATRAVNSSCST